MAQSTLSEDKTLFGKIGAVSEKSLRESAHQRNDDEPRECEQIRQGPSECKDPSPKLADNGYLDGDHSYYSDELQNTNKHCRELFHSASRVRHAVCYTFSWWVIVLHNSLVCIETQPLN